MRSPSRHEPETEMTLTRAGSLLAGILGAAGALVAGGRLLGPLPPLGARATARWVTVTPPLESLVQLGRLLGLGLCLYLAVVVLAMVAARRGDRRWLLGLVDALTFPTLRRSLATAAAVTVVSGTLTATSVSAPRAAFASPSDRGVATMELIDGDSPTTSSTPPPDPETAVMRRLDDDAPPEGTDAGDHAMPGGHPLDDGSHRDTGTGPRASSIAPPTTPETVPDHGRSGGTWTIQPGDHLWHVSETTLATAWGRPPTDAETATYLGELIRANRDELVIPDNPDLVFAGQTFSLPTPALPTPAGP